MVGLLAIAFYPFSKMVFSKNSIHLSDPIYLTYRFKRYGESIENTDFALIHDIGVMGG